jgi:UDP-N-acetylglucosamine--N-acetylmuramyl-(pentapeptide) pyrophosphoryl-undecaprenol N-acetylglucosamine transferase
MLSDVEAKERLVGEALGLLEQTDKRADMARAIKTLARPDAAEQIAREVLGLIKN